MFLLRLFKWLVRRTWNTSRLTFLITLPITWLNLICGIIDGVLITLWVSDSIRGTTSALVADVTAASYDFYSFGADGSKNEFHTEGLRAYNWVDSLGFLQPDEHTIAKQQASRINIQMYGDLTSLMYYPPSWYQRQPTTDQWVYVTDHVSPIENEWDAAFDQLVQSSYMAGSAVNKTTLFHVNCQKTGNFLCRYWKVRTPTLLHFHISDNLVGKDDIQPGFTYTVENARKLRPVEVRAIEFPLTAGIHTGISSRTFPTPFKQLQAIMYGDRLYEQYRQYDLEAQFMTRFRQHANEGFWDRKGNAIYYIGRADKLWNKYVGKTLDLEDFCIGVYRSTFHLTFNIGSIVAIPLFRIKDWFAAKFPTKTPAAQPLYVSEDPTENEANMFMRSMLKAFWENITEEEEIANRKLVQEGGTTRPPLPEWTDVVDRVEGALASGKGKKQETKTK